MSRIVEACDSAIRYLGEAHEGGYGAVGHRTGDHSATKFLRGAETITQSGAEASMFEGKTFHIAVITDSLLDAIDVGVLTTADMVKENVEVLLAMREGDAWRYFPGVEELPHDADDLGQIAQVIVRAGAIDIDVLDRAFGLAAASSWPDGAINTWLVPDLEVRVQMNQLWGRGIHDSGRDPEVVSNAAYAAALYDEATGRSRWSDLVRASADWVAAQQHPFGFWRPGWYVGAHYATYVAVRLLSRLGGFPERIDAALAWMSDSVATDPLNRSFHILTTWHAERPCAAADFDFVLDAQLPDGSWEAIPLLDSHGRAWGSRPLATAFCLKALTTRLRVER